MVNKWLAILAIGLLAVFAFGAGALIGLDEDDRRSRVFRGAVPKGRQVPGRNTALQVAAGMRVALRDWPGGEIVSRIGDSTEFGSPEILSPTGQQRGPWAAIRHTSLGNDGEAWINTDRAPLIWRPLRVRVEVDLSRRELVVISRAGRVRRTPVAVGAPDTPTPSGEYYVTDKLRGADFGPYYGCYILALSGSQPNLPQDWSGGDRLAIHGSPAPTWGRNVSNGCLHAPPTDLRYLMKTVPLGTRVLVRA